MCAHRPRACNVVSDGRVCRSLLRSPCASGSFRLLGPFRSSSLSNPTLPCSVISSGGWRGRTSQGSFIEKAHAVAGPGKSQFIARAPYRFRYVKARYPPLHLVRKCSTCDLYPPPRLLYQLRSRSHELYLKQYAPHPLPAVLLGLAYCVSLL